MTIELEIHEAMHRMAGRIQEEAVSAMAKYGAFASMHEGYGVLAEEFHELFLAVCMRQDNTQRPINIEREAIQVAAMALRMAIECRRTTR